MYKSKTKYGLKLLKDKHYINNMLHEAYQFVYFKEIDRHSASDSEFVPVIPV